MYYPLKLSGGGSGNIYDPAKHCILCFPKKHKDKANLSSTPNGMEKIREVSFFGKTWPISIFVINKCATEKYCTDIL